MNTPRELLRRIRMLFHRGQFQSDLDEEMRLHLELREQEQVEAGCACERRSPGCVSQVWESDCD